ncbi:hypothetical protein BFW38_01185 [Terasakiispira papahanaumokuakeensis]|uniref:DUF3352 domain-containing protein n=1 Tax=Terasakiispira papahanaumokuakeensis TaxID=197479 RepID=A0A1E2V5T0_9GAMM|nr:hypothetical protein [Terasakiispira papahanaumokuakeensis]ODC02358.1 hypothetical protein BFW38_01185 [Terasakiispira papahanaumokuakeensis]
MQKGAKLGVSILAIGVLGAGAAGWLTGFGQKGGDNPILSHIPADTALFAGNMTPLDTADLDKLSAMVTPVASAMKQALAQVMAEEDVNDWTPGAKLLLTMLNDSLSGDQAQKLTEMGIAAPLNDALYSVGPHPVFRLQLADTEKFQQWLSAQIKNADVSTETVKLGEHEYQRLPLTPENETPKLYLAITLDGDQMVMTVDSSDLVDSDNLAIALGTKDPQKALADTRRLQDLAKKYDLTGQSMFVIDHQAIVEAITHRDSEFSQLLAAMDEQKHNRLDMANAPQYTQACQDEMGAIAAAWPRTVGGYTSLQLQEYPMSIKSRTIIESNDQATLDSLMALQGQWPALNDHQGEKFGIQLGLKVSELGNTLSSLWGRAMEAQWQCAPLQQMQAQLAQANPAMIGMGAAMAQGVNGLGFSLYDADLSAMIQTGQPKDLSATVSIAADNPQNLWAQASVMLPMLKNQTLPPKGEAMALPIPGAPVALKLMRHDQMLNVYTGKPAETLMRELPESPKFEQGLMRVSQDLGFIAQAMKTMTENDDVMRQMSYRDEDATEALANSKALMESMSGLRQVSVIKVTDQGFEADDTLYFRQ